MEAFRATTGVFYDSNFEIVNRVFYATIDKFTKQSCPDASRRRSTPYSFLENWHLHSIYSKSQQTLLGITPVKPSVLLSGDDFMFTPPFIQPEETLFEEEDEYIDNSFYLPLSPCSESSLVFDCCNEAIFDDTTFDESLLSILIPDEDDSPDEPELSPCSSIDENPISTHSSINSIDEQEDVVPPSTTRPVIKSSSFLSQKSSLDNNSSIMSYQSLADLIHSPTIKNSNNYGSTMIAPNHTPPPPPPQPPIWNRLLYYFMSLWQVFIHFSETCFHHNNEEQPLIP